MSAAVKVRAKARWRPNGPAEAGFSIFDERGAHIWCRTRVCANYIAEQLRRAPTTDQTTFARINRALEVEGDPLTCFPPAAAGDVVGEVEPTP